MYNLTTETQTILEVESNGDSKPVIYDQRVVWVNKSNGKNDIHVLDFELDGMPHNVTVDIGQDMAIEFSWPGQLSNTEYMNGTLPVDALNKYLNSIVPGTTEIPISISADGTGRAWK